MFYLLLYGVLDFTNNMCVYCGDWFQCRDHVVPISWQQTYRNYRRGETVKCCTLCNTLAGDSVHFSLLSKAEYLIKRYHKKFKKILLLPEWTLDEMEELDYGLQAYVLQRQHLKHLVLFKLENLSRSSCGLDVEPLRAFDSHDEAMKAMKSL